MSVSVQRERARRTTPEALQTPSERTLSEASPSYPGSLFLLVREPSPRPYCTSNANPTDPAGVNTKTKAEDSSTRWICRGTLYQDCSVG